MFSVFAVGAVGGGGCGDFVLFLSCSIVVALDGGDFDLMLLSSSFFD